MSTTGKGVASIPLVDLAAQYNSIRAEIDAAVARVLTSGWYILGPEVEAFEAEFAAFCGAPHGVGVASGTDAISLALLACGVLPGDEVITSPLTAVPTMTAIMVIGARPVFADINPQTLTIGPDAVEAAVTPRTTAVVPVHLYGHVADLPAILEVAHRHNLVVVEDACQAHGALLNGRRVGTFGKAGCFSFYPTKNLGAFGDGGMVVTSDPSIAERLRRLRHYGQVSRYHALELGRNSRLDEIQAAILQVKLPYLEGWNARRRELAGLYEEELPRGKVSIVSPLPGSMPVYHLYVIQTAQRQALRDALAERGIATEVHYPVPCHLQEAASRLGYRQGAFPHAEAAADSVVSLPCYPQATDAVALRVCEAIHAHLLRP